NVPLFRSNWCRSVARRVPASVVMIFSLSRGRRPSSADQDDSSDQRISPAKGSICPCPRSVNRTAFLPCRSGGSIGQFADHRRCPVLSETTTAPLSAGKAARGLIRSNPHRRTIQTAFSIKLNVLTQAQVGF